ncbi:ABC transporter ATP-binding protein [Actinopolymorpha sp. NPDC004070]|uniref:ABC transporter ATP-binding protein n=1 Tax=Actinopolymorpha sp. NPDC004070 TaxID=3154548 RepID=UPI0033A99D5B
MHRYTETTRRYALHARLLWRAAPAHSALNLLLVVASAATVTFGIVATGRLVGALPAAVNAGAGSAAADRAWWWLAAAAAAYILAPLIHAVHNAVTQVVSARYLRLVFGMVADVGTVPYGIAHLEDPEVAGRLDAVKRAMRDWTFVTGVDETWNLLANRLTGAGALIVVATWNWWAALLAAGSYALLAKVFVAWIGTIFDDLLEATGNQRRQASYVRDLMTGAPAAKELRLFGLADWLVHRYSTAWRDAMTVVWRNRQRNLRPILVTCAIMLVVNAGVLALLARDASAGTVSLASLVTLVQGLLALEAFGPLGDNQSALARNTSATTMLVALRARLGLPDLPALPNLPDLPDLSPRSPAGRTPETSAATRTAGAEIDLRDVTFHYPSRDEPTVERLSLHIPAGQSVAVVGVNGAGKSTLIKLLCGLHPPDAGTIRIDGGDPSADEATRNRVAVIFQDFVRYHLPLRDNVGFGAHARHDDEVVLAKALDDAGGTTLLSRLEHGWDTVLSAEYAGGTDLSGGQWQRVALARALAAVAGGAGVLVLDEPTAALDVRAEAALFDRFLEMTRGMTTLLVSHRLSSVRHADRIVVIGPTGDPARTGTSVIEDGSHAELMAAGGAYARMFSLQAARFAAAGAGGTDAGRTGGTAGTAVEPR